MSNEKFALPARDVEALLKNGVEFLDKAIDEFEAKHYKYSVVSFWTAVEILLKVPLASEHWTLVCTGKKVSRKSYLTGDFQSVSYEETCDRLEGILEKPLPAATKALFKAIKNHRNRVVHFFHKDFSEEDVKTILAEQAGAWFALNRYIRDDWREVFGATHSWKLAFSETRLLRSNSFYAEARLRHIQPELDEIRERGLQLTPCPDCGQNAVVMTPEDTGVQERTLLVTRCCVCSGYSRHILLKCPECEERQSLSEDISDQVFSCEHCDYTSDRFELLNEETFRSVDEQMYSNLPAGCTHCMSPNSVCKFGNGYLCTACLIFYKDLTQCENCNHWSDSVSEFSQFKGCDFCEVNQQYIEN